MPELGHSTGLPVAIKRRGALFSMYDYLWAVGMLISIGLIVYGMVSKNHILTDTVVWIFIAYSLVATAVRIFRRLARKGER
jgi:hypothetical protein